MTTGVTSKCNSADLVQPDAQSALGIAVHISSVRHAIFPKLRFESGEKVNKSSNRFSVLKRSGSLFECRNRPKRFERETRQHWSALVRRDDVETRATSFGGDLGSSGHHCFEQSLSSPLPDMSEFDRSQ
jgi:hypothetical protein